LWTHLEEDADGQLLAHPLPMQDSGMIMAMRPPSSDARTSRRLNQLKAAEQSLTMETGKARFAESDGLCGIWINPLISARPVEPTSNRLHPCLRRFDEVLFLIWLLPANY
jgi:hypothetical protein